jgi:ADP-ribose pyrophosphatase
MRHAPGSDEHLLWRERQRRRLATLSVFDIFAATRVSPSGASGEFCLIETPDWVNVVPLVSGQLGEERFLMVRQFRHGAGSITTEFPAGLVDTGESPLETAVRELREETGSAAGRLTLIGKTAPNPAFMTNWCYTYLAEEISETGQADLDDLEALERCEVSARELDERIGTGEFTNSLVLVAYLLYRRHRERESRGERGADRN